MALNNNGMERFDASQDGANLEVAGCSVEIRRPTVATKAKLTYIRGGYLEVS